MSARFSPEHWADEGWYVGRLKEVPGVFSPGETLEELEENVRDACHLMADAQPAVTHREIMARGIEVGA